jgi:hypothetical protein
MTDRAARRRVLAAGFARLNADLKRLRPIEPPGEPHAILAV